MSAKDNLNETLADAVMNRPREFFIDHQRYCLWPLTLGMSLIIERHLAALGIDDDVLAEDPAMEAMRLVSGKRAEVCYILAIFSLRKYSELSNTLTITQRANAFESKLSDEELAQLLLIALSEPKAETLVSLSGIANEQKEQARIACHKNRDGHTLTFGGKTIYGTLIDAACSKYGWTKEYVVWGIDLVSLRMMLADTVNSVYLSDEEMKAVRIVAGDAIDANDPAIVTKLRSMDWS